MRGDEGRAGRDARSVRALGGLVEAGTRLLRCAIEVVVPGGGTERGGCLHERLARHGWRSIVDDGQRACIAVELSGLGAVVALRAFEVRQHVRVAPAVVAQGCPGVEVAAVAPGVDHRVDSARPAQHPAPGDVNTPAFEACLRLRRVSPVLLALGIPEAIHGIEAALVIDCGVGVHPTQLQQGDPRCWVFAQACSNNAAGGAGSHHQVVDCCLVDHE